MCGLQYHEKSYLKPPNNSFLLKPGLTLKLQTRTNKYNAPPRREQTHCMARRGPSEHQTQLVTSSQHQDAASVAA